MIHISKEEIRNKMFFIRNEDSDRQIAVIEVSELLKCQSNSQCKWEIARETDIEVVAKDAYEQGYTDGWKERYGEPEVYMTAKDYNLYLEGYKQGEKDFGRPQGEWIPVSERLPEQNGYYITTCRDICENRVHTVGFDGVRKKWGRGGVIAWQPLPEPYKQD